MGQKEVAIALGDQELAALDRAVSEGRFASRDEAIREAVAQLLRQDASGNIAEAYRRAYAERPEDEWVGEAGARLMAERVLELQKREE